MVGAFLVLGGTSILNFVVAVLIYIPTNNEDVPFLLQICVCVHMHVCGCVCVCVCVCG
jgi:hypothetical protein